MKKVKVIFFNPSSHFTLMDNPLEQGVDLVKVPLHYQLSRHDVQKDRTVILLYYSSFGRQKLIELKQSFPRIPVIFLAKRARKEDLLQALRLGGSDFLFLPLKVRELRTAIDQATQLSNRSAPKSLIFENSLDWMNRVKFLFKKLLQGKALVPEQKFDTLEITPLGSRMMMKSLEEEVETADIQVKFFGFFELKVRGKKLSPLKGKKNNALLAYLLFHHEKPTHREELISTFWSRTGYDSGRNSLNVAICNIRKYLSRFFPGQELILLERDRYCINPELEIVTDVEHFKRLWKKGRKIEHSQGLVSALGAYHKALSYYVGDLLEEMRFEEWCESHRDNLKETYLFTLNRIAAHYFQGKEYDACIAVCNRMLEKDACQEDVHRKLMECYNQLSMNDLARHQYIKCEKILSQELSIKPSNQTRKLYQEIGSVS